MRCVCVCEQSMCMHGCICLCVRVCMCVCMRVCLKKARPGHSSSVWECMRPRLPPSAPERYFFLQPGVISPCFEVSRRVEWWNEVVEGVVVAAGGAGWRWGGEEYPSCPLNHAFAIWYCKQSDYVAAFWKGYCCQHSIAFWRAPAIQKQASILQRAGSSSRS